MAGGKKCPNCAKLLKQNAQLCAMVLKILYLEYDREDLIKEAEKLLDEQLK